MRTTEDPAVVEARERTYTRRQFLVYRHVIATPQERLVAWDAEVLVDGAHQGDEDVAGAQGDLDEVMTWAEWLAVGT